MPGKVRLPAPQRLDAERLATGLAGVTVPGRDDIGQCLAASEQFACETLAALTCPQYLLRIMREAGAQDQAAAVHREPASR